MCGSSFILPRHQYARNAVRLNAVVKSSPTLCASKPLTRSAASASAASSAAAAAASAASGILFAPGGSSVFLVEDVERPQADVGDFFLTESDLRWGGIPRRYIRRRHSGCRGCAACQRQRHTDNPKHRYGFLRIFSLRSTFRLRHSLSPPTPASEYSTPETLFVRFAHAPGKADCAH